MMIFIITPMIPKIYLQTNGAGKSLMPYLIKIIIFLRGINLNFYTFDLSTV